MTRATMLPATTLAFGLAMLGALAVLHGQPAPTDTSQELPVRVIPGLYTAAEAYFSPDGQSMIMNAKRSADEDEYHVYTSTIDGKTIRQINGVGADACSYYFPDGTRVVFTSTRDNLHLPRGNYSDVKDYPTGAELYIADVDGSNVKRLTHNQLYEAEVSVSPDGRWILFGRLTDGRMELWRMRPDGTGEFQITDTPELQEGGAFYMPDSEHIIYRAWKRADEGQRGTPMTIYVIKHDGTGMRAITTEPVMNWAPHPAPDGKHFVFVKIVGRGNFEVFLMNIETGTQTRLTHNDAFDGFPAFSPDGKTVGFSSSRNFPSGERRMAVYLMDVSSFMGR
jgi:Tol biopolymer transport system component